MIAVFSRHDNIMKSVWCGFWLLLFLTSYVSCNLIPIHASDNNISLQHHTTPSLQTSREKRAVDCPPSPQGEPECCIPRQDEFLTLTYEHTDESGNTCSCNYCLPPQYAETPCVCTASGAVENCVSVIRGETYMPYRNKCNKPFICTATCPGNLVIIKPCDKDKDSMCGCKDWFYQTGDATCSETPKCGVNFKLELAQLADEKYTSYTCVPCDVHEHCPGEVTTAETVKTIITSIFLTYGATSSTPTFQQSTTHAAVQEITNNGSHVTNILLITVAVLFTLFCVLLFIVIVRVCFCRGRKKRRDAAVIANPGNIVLANIPNDGDGEDAV